MSAVFLSAPLVVAVVVVLAWWRARPVVTVYPSVTGLLYRDGRFARVLPPGRHRFARRTCAVLVPAGEQVVPLPEVTVLSRDQFSFRVALAAVAQVADARIFAEGQPTFFHAATVTIGPDAAALHPHVGAAALEAGAALTLVELLDDRPAFVAGVAARLGAPVPGLQVARLLLTGINLPPETRRMFTDVERARRGAEASLERARGEQAALRALANAARLIKDNPGLAELRLLQAVEGAKGATLVLGSAETAALAGRAPAR